MAFLSNKFLIKRCAERRETTNFVKKHALYKGYSLNPVKINHLFEIDSPSDKHGKHIDQCLNEYYCPSH